MENAIKQLCDACSEGDIKTVKDILRRKVVDINHLFDGKTPLMCAMLRNDLLCNQVDIVSHLLTQPELQLDKRDSCGWTALHWACYNNNPIAVRLFCQDTRCFPSIVNIKNKSGETALMRAVNYGHIEVVQEMENVEGADFRIKDSYGRNLIEMARRLGHDAVVEHLVERNKVVDSLTMIAAYSVAKYVEDPSDVEYLEIPDALQRLVAGFVGTQRSPIHMQPRTTENFGTLRKFWTKFLKFS